MAFKATCAIQDAGLKVSSESAVNCYHNREFLKLFPPQLTKVGMQV